MQLSMIPSSRPKELSQHAGRRVPDLQQHQRKCTIMFELSVNLERILEFLSLEIPAIFLRGLVHGSSCRPPLHPLPRPLHVRVDWACADLCAVQDRQ